MNIIEIEIKENNNSNQFNINNKANKIQIFNN